MKILSREFVPSSLKNIFLHNVEDIEIRNIESHHWIHLTAGAKELNGVWRITGHDRSSVSASRCTWSQNRCERRDSIESCDTSSHEREHMYGLRSWHRFHKGHETKVIEILRSIRWSFRDEQHRNVITNNESFSRRPAYKWLQRLQSPLDNVNVAMDFSSTKFVLMTFDCEPYQ